MAAMPETGGYSTRGVSARTVGVLTAALVRQLAAERRRQGLSVSQLRELLAGGWSADALYHAEAGRKLPSVELLACWAAALGLQLTLVPASEATP